MLAHPLALPRVSRPIGFGVAAVASSQQNAGAVRGSGYTLASAVTQAGESSQHRSYTHVYAVASLRRCAPLRLFPPSPTNAPSSNATGYETNHTLISAILDADNKPTTVFRVSLQPRTEVLVSYLLSPYVEELEVRL